MNRADREVLDAYRAQPGLPPSPEVRAVLARAASVIAFARRGASQPYSDYELAYEEGFDLVLPHLGSMRGISRIMQADAYVRLHDGDVTGASNRIASLYRMGEHAGSDRLVISSLVGQAVWDAGDQALQVAIDRGVLNAADAGTVLRAAMDAPTQDPFSYVEATVMEQELAVASLERHVLNEGDAGIEKLKLFMPIQEIPIELGTMTTDDLHADLDRYHAMMGEVTEVFATGDREAGLAKLNEMTERIEAGEYGVLAMIFAPAFGKLFEIKLDGERKIRDRIEVLEALTTDEDAALAEANAARWYLAAIEKMTATKAWDEAALVALRVTHREATTPTGEKLVAALAASDEILASLREAAGMKRCDFAFARNATLRAPDIAPDYAPGLRDLLRLVLADAEGQLARGDHDAYLDRLRIAWTMVAHTQADGIFATAIMSHAAFNRTTRLTRRGVTAELLTRDDQSELLGLAKRVRRTDPFGYVLAVVKARESLTAHYNRVIPYANENLELRQQVAEAIRELLDGDHLLSIGVIMDTMRQDGEGELDERTRMLQPLDDVYDLAQLEASRADVSEVAPLLADHDIFALSELAIRDIGSIRRRTTEARADLGRALRELTSAKDGSAAP